VARERLCSASPAWIECETCLNDSDASISPGSAVKTSFLSRTLKGIDPRSHVCLKCSVAVWPLRLFVCLLGLLYSCIAAGSPARDVSVGSN